MSHESLDGLLATGEEKPAVPPRLTTPRAALEVAAAPSAPSAPPVPPPRGEGKAPPSDVPVAAAALLPQQPAPSPQQPAPQHFGQPAPAPHGKEQALPVAAAAAPHAQPGMDRAGVPPVDPVRVLSSLSTEELGKIPALDMLQLSAYFASLGLPELPATVVRNGLNGSILHTLSAAGTFAPRSCGPAPRQRANSPAGAGLPRLHACQSQSQRRRPDGPPFTRRGQGVPDALRPSRHGGPLRDAPGGADGATTDVLGQDPRVARRAVQLPQHVRGQGRAQPN